MPFQFKKLFHLPQKQLLEFLKAVLADMTVMGTSAFLSFGTTINKIGTAEISAMINPFR